MCFIVITSRSVHTV